MKIKNPFIFKFKNETPTEEIDIFKLVEKFPITKTSEPTTLVWKTKDYSIFKPHLDNRDIVEKQIKKLKISMEEYGWIPGSYVIILPDGRMLDGHHRVDVAKESNNYVYYIVVDETCENHVSMLNTNKEPWRPINYIKTYAKRGNENYKQLVNFIQEFPEISPSNCMRICTNTDCSVSGKTVENELFEIKDINKARLWGAQLRMLRPYLRDRKDQPETSQFMNSSFVRAFLYIAKQENFDFVKLHNNIKQVGHFEREDGLPRTKEILIQIYNND